MLFTLIPTGISGLDEIVGGGLPQPSVVGLIGKNDCDKSLMARQIAWNAVTLGCNVLYYSMDESAEAVQSCMRHYGWDITEYVRECQFHFIDVFSHGIEVVENYHLCAQPSEYINQIFTFNYLLKEGQDFCLKKMTENDLLIIIDSLDPMVLLTDTKETLSFIENMKFMTQPASSISITTINLDIHDPKFNESYKQLTDVLIELRKIDKEGSINGYVRITKGPKQFHSGFYPLEIEEKHGIKIYPITVSLS